MIAAGTIGTTPALGLVACAALLEVPHNAARRVKPEGTAAAQQHTVHVRDPVGRSQQVGLARARRRPAHVHAADGTRLAEHGSAAGAIRRIRVVAHGDARNTSVMPLAVIERSSSLPW